MSRSQASVAVDSDRRADETDSQLLNRAIARLREGHGGGVIDLAPRSYAITETIVLPSGITLRGQGTAATTLRATQDLSGPVVASVDAESLALRDAWLVSEGVPYRFGLSDLCIDGAAVRKTGGFGDGVGALFYGKGFAVTGVQITGTRSHGLFSSGSARGGQEVWQDEPEAVFDVRISRAGGDGFIMRGPHDSVIRSAIIAICKGRGLAVEQAGKTNGACDIEFCHAYATDGHAIDLQAKVKAGFLQGDTGRGSGVRISGSNKSYISRIECFKTRGSTADFALDIRAPALQIGLARVRADWGTSGVRVAATDVQIGQMDIDGMRNTGGPMADTPNDGTALQVEGNFLQAGQVNIRNFRQGTGIAVAPGTVGTLLTGTTSNCHRHIQARGLKHSRIDLIARTQPDDVIEAASSPTDRISVVDTRGAVNSKLQ